MDGSTGPPGVKDSATSCRYTGWAERMIDERQDTPQRANTLNAEKIHSLGNQLGIILGFVDLVLESTPEEDSRRPDLLEIKQAAEAALALIGGGRRSS